MKNQFMYENFITWMKRTWIGLPDSEALLPAIKARYSGEEAALLTEMPFSPKSIRELAAQKEMDPTELTGRLDALAQKVVWVAISCHSTGFIALQSATGVRC